MKTTHGKKFIEYILKNFIGNFLGFAVGMASTRIVSHFFATRSIKNLWGLTARKTIIDKQTFGFLELAISIVIGYIVFEIISKWFREKLMTYAPRIKTWLAQWNEPQTVSE